MAWSDTTYWCIQSGDKWHTWFSSFLIFFWRESEWKWKTVKHFPLTDSTQLIEQGTLLPSEFLDMYVGREGCFRNGRSHFLCSLGITWWPFGVWLNWWLLRYKNLNWSLGRFCPARIPWVPGIPIDHPAWRWEGMGGSGPRELGGCHLYKPASSARQSISPEIQHGRKLSPWSMQTGLLILWLSNKNEVLSITLYYHGSCT